MEIPAAIIEEWKNLAIKAGLTKEGSKYSDEYEHHLGMVEHPIPFSLWKEKFDLLIMIQSREDYQSGEYCPYDKKAQQLCEELGY